MRVYFSDSDLVSSDDHERASSSHRGPSDGEDRLSSGADVWREGTGRTERQRLAVGSRQQGQSLSLSLSLSLYGTKIM